MATLNKKERTGELFVFLNLCIAGLSPILSNYATKIMPPLLFAGSSIIVAGLTMFIYSAITSNLFSIVGKKIWLYLLGVTFFIVIIPGIFIFTGTSKTSGINTAILLQTELLFTFIVCGLFLKEKITARKIFGALMILSGATVILYKGSFSFNIGDLLIIIGTAFYPIGNMFAKKALRLTAPSNILFVRNLLGGSALIAISLMFEKYSLTPFEYLKNNWIVIAVAGIAVYAFAKLLWYYGLRLMEISKAISLGIASPAFSLFYAFLILKEIPNIYQFAGLLVIMTGLFILTRQKTAVAEIKD